MNGNPGRPLVTPERREEDAAEASLRPQKLVEFVGQEQARKNLVGNGRDLWIYGTSEVRGQSSSLTRLANLIGNG